MKCDLIPEMSVFFLHTSVCVCVCSRQILLLFYYYKTKQQQKKTSERKKEKGVQCIKIVICLFIFFVVL